MPAVIKRELACRLHARLQFGDRSDGFVTLHHEDRFAHASFAKSRKRLVRKHFSSSNEYDVVTDRSNFSKHMRGKQHGCCRAEFTQQVSERDELRRVKSNRGFIKNEQRRRTENRRSKSHALLESLGKSTRDCARHLRKITTTDCDRNFIPQLASNEPPQSTAVQQKLGDSQFRMQRRGLRQIAHARADLCAMRRRVKTKDRERALIWRKHSRDESNRRGLSRAIGAEKPSDSNRGQLQINAIHGRKSGESFGEASGENAVRHAKEGDRRSRVQECTEAPQFSIGRGTLARFV